MAVVKYRVNFLFFPFEETFSQTFLSLSPFIFLPILFREEWKFSSRDVYLWATDNRTNKSRTENSAESNYEHKNFLQSFQVVLKRRKFRSRFARNCIVNHKTSGLMELNLISSSLTKDSFVLLLVVRKFVNRKRLLCFVAGKSKRKVVIENNKKARQQKNIDKAFSEEVILMKWVWRSTWGKVAKCLRVRVGKTQWISITTEHRQKKHEANFDKEN